MSAANAIQNGEFDINLISLRKPLEFPDLTIQETAYTGGTGIPTLEEVLTSGDDAQNLDILGVQNLQVNGQIQLTSTGNTKNFDGEINQITIGYTYAGNQLQPTVISSNTGQSTNAALQILDNNSSSRLDFLPQATSNARNPIVAAGDFVIAGVSASRNLAITCDSATTTGIRITDTSTLIGSGGSGDDPSNRVDFSSAGNLEYGNHQFVNGLAQYSAIGNATAIIPSCPSTSASVIPAFEFLFHKVEGNSSTATATLSLIRNLTNTTNYAVFPSIYYGFSGSAGTFNASGTSGACGQIVITAITAANFTFALSKATGDNVNIYLNFLVVYNIDRSDAYLKNY